MLGGGGGGEEQREGAELGAREEAGETRRGVAGRWTTFCNCSGDTPSRSAT